MDAAKALRTVPGTGTPQGTGLSCPAAAHCLAQELRPKTQQVVRNAITCTKRCGNIGVGGGKTDPKNGSRKVLTERQNLSCA